MGSCYMTEYTTNKKRKEEDLKKGIHQLSGLKEKETENEEEEMKKIERVKELNNHGECCNEQLPGTMKEKSIVDPQISLRELYMEGLDSPLGILDCSHPMKLGGRPTDFPTKGVGGKLLGLFSLGGSTRVDTTRHWCGYGICVRHGVHIWDTVMLEVGEDWTVISAIVEQIEAWSSKGEDEDRRPKDEETSF